MATMAESFDEHWLEDLQTGCWMWQRGRCGRDAKLGLDRGYGCLQINGRQIGAHRFSYEREYGPIKAGLEIRHQCHRTLCVNPAHMKLGTNMQNAKDRIDAGRYAKHLTPEIVKVIRERCAAGEMQRVVGADYGVHRGYVSNIVNRKYWKHVK